MASWHDPDINPYMGKPKWRRNTRYVLRISLIRIELYYKLAPIKLRQLKLRYKRWRLG